MGHIAGEKLNDQQVAFAVAYLKCFNATKAAKEAGYSKNTAYSQGQRLLKHAEVVEYIHEHLDTEGITPERIKIALADIAFDGNIQAFEAWLEGGDTLADLDGEGVNTQLVKSIQVSDTKEGQNRKIVLYDRLDALDKLARISAMFIDRREVEHSGGVALVTNVSVQPAKPKEPDNDSDDG